MYIQPSNLRVFTDDEYREVRRLLCFSDICKAGAIVQEDLTPAHTIIAVKVRGIQKLISLIQTQEVPSTLLIEGRTYMYFSHTIKAQPSNMPMLDTILQKVRSIG